MQTNLINNMNTLATLAKGGAPQASQSQPVTGDFQSLISKGISKVSETQKASSELKDAFARGENVAVEDIMLASNEASIYFSAFQTTTQRVIDSYKEISSMTI